MQRNPVPVVQDDDEHSPSLSSSFSHAGLSSPTKHAHFEDAGSLSDDGYESDYENLNAEFSDEDMDSDFEDSQIHPEMDDDESNKCYQSLCEAIDRFKGRLKASYSDEHSIPVLFACDKMRVLVSEELENNSDAAKRIAVYLSTMLQTLHLDSLTHKNDQDANKAYNLAAINVFMTQVDQVSASNRLKKMAIFVCHTLLCLVLGVSITAGLVGGLSNIPTAAAALPYYAGKGFLNKHFISSMAKLTLPTLAMSVPMAASWSSLFNKRPICKGAENLSNELKHLITTPR